MKRREFISVLGAAAATPLLRPHAAHAQQPMPVIGFLSSISLQLRADYLVAFRQGLKQGGFVEGQNVAIVYRSGDGERDRLPGLATDLLRRGVTVIVGVGSGEPARAAKAATSTIPIVFAMGGDPVGTKIVDKLNKPGGNVTGTTWFATELLPKRLELLHDLLPSLRRVGFLLHPKNVSSDSDARNLEAAAHTLGLDMTVLKAGTEREIESAFAVAAQSGLQAIVVQAESLFTTHRDRIIELAAKLALPTIYTDRTFASRGGLMSYDADRKESLRETGVYVTRILKGEKPADLPVLQPTKFEFVINRKAAKALGITFPPSFELRATEVIE